MLFATMYEATNIVAMCSNGGRFLRWTQLFLCVWIPRPDSAVRRRGNKGLILVTQQNIVYPIGMHLGTLSELCRRRFCLAGLEGLNVRLPLLLKWNRLLNADYSPLDSASHLSKYVAVAAEILAVVCFLFDNVVCPVRHNLPSAPAAAILVNTITSGPMLEREAKVPRDH